MTEKSLSSTTHSASPRINADIPRKEMPCNLCGHNDHHPFCPENGRGLVQCDNCGLVYVHAQPDATELYALYGETYFHNDDSGTVGYTDYIADEANIRRTFQGRLRRIEKFVAPGRLLDVGCAAGFFMDEAHKRGWDVAGMDVSGFAVQYVRDRFGYDAQHGSLTDLDYPAESYDLITMWDVIEHVPDPMAYVQQVATLLRPDGIFSLATPDVGSIPARLTGKRWVGYKLQEEHVYYFSVKTLKRMLDEAGFDVVEVRHVGKYVTMSLFLDRLGMYSPLIAKTLGLFERAFKLSERAFYVNPYDIVSVTARKRSDS
ncbi:MAG: class I SAM-dependent methyltransferase [Chloroflexi bacterium]|nr:MAG: class I SAM-dependent methyltransferase [Chloroflexota bacterium]